MSNMTPATDTSVSIPAAARAAAERAEELHRQVYKKDEPAAEAAAEPASEVTPGVTPEVTQPSQPAKPREQAAEPAEDFKHKYNSMKGRYERAEQQLNALTSSISARDAELAELRAEIERLKSEPSNTQLERFITPEEENDYGAELLGVVGKKAKEVFSPEVAAMKREIETLKAQLNNVGQTVTGSARQQMHTALDRDCPNWREINQNEEFLAWLKLPDLYSGVIRHDLLSAAYERNDSPRVLAFFNGFLAEEAATDPASAEFSLTPAPAPAPGAEPAPRVKLEQLAAPGRAKTAAASTPAEKPIITRAQITQFYADVAAGRYRGKDAEKTQHEQMIFLAEREGRIR